jgi:polyisoprenoid-binding protein YceI
MVGRVIFFIGYLGGALILVLPAAVGAPALLPAGTFEIAPGDSSVVFAVPDNRGGFSGRTTQVTGRVVIEPPTDGGEYNARVVGAIDAASLTTGNGSRDGSMRADFLRTREFPKITFTGTVSARPGLGVRPFPAVVRGRLTIRDVTRDVEFPATVVALAREYRADGTVKIRMADFGIPYPRAFIFVARDPVTITLHILARQH